MREEEINILILKYLEGACSGEERRRLEDWLAEDARHRVHFEQVSAIGRTLTQIDFRLEPETEAEWEKLRAAIGREPAPVRPLRRRARSGRIWAVAAGVGALLVAIWLVALYLRDSRVAPAAAEFAAERGGTRRVELPDGSVVRLNADSRLILDPDYGRRERRLTLSGEAYFDVRPDRRSPFVVNAGDAYVRVLGTVFNVEAYPENPVVSVAVVEGRVRFAAGGGQGIILEPETAGRFDTGSGRFTKEPFRMQEALDWLEGRLVFPDNPLPDILRAVERRYDVRIDDRAGLGDRQFSDIIEPADSLTGFLDRLALTFSISYRRDGDTVVLTPN